jgi:hypothetical protein
MSRKKAEPADEMEVVVPLVSFLGYPDDKTPMDFRAGVKSAPIPAEYAALLRSKKLVPQTGTTETTSPAVD